MRATNAKRNKSCGCLKRDKWHQHQVARKPRKLMPTLPESVWTPFDDSKLVPKAIITQVSALGLYVPQCKGTIRPKSLKGNSPALHSTKESSS